MPYAVEMARLLKSRGVPARATGRLRFELTLPKLPPGARVTFSRAGHTEEDPADPFYGWLMRVRVPRRTYTEMQETRRKAFHAVWVALHGAGLVPTEPPERPEDVALPTEEDTEA